MVHWELETVAAEPSTRGSERPTSGPPSLTRKRMPAGWE